MHLLGRDTRCSPRSCTGERSYHLHQIEALTSNTYCWVLRCGAAGDFVRLSDEERKGNSCLARRRDTNHLGGHHPNHSPIHNGTVDAKCHPGEGGKGHFPRAWSMFCASIRCFLYGVSQCPLAPNVSEVLPGWHTESVSLILELSGDDGTSSDAAQEQWCPSASPSPCSASHGRAFPISYLPSCRCSYAELSRTWLPLKRGRSRERGKKRKKSPHPEPN